MAGYSRYAETEDYVNYTRSEGWEKGGEGKRRMKDEG